MLKSRVSIRRVRVETEPFSFRELIASYTERFGSRLQAQLWVVVTFTVIFNL